MGLEIELLKSYHFLYKHHLQFPRASLLSKADFRTGWWKGTEGGTKLWKRGEKKVRKKGGNAKKKTPKPDGDFGFRNLGLSLVSQFLILSHVHTLARNEGGERKTNVVLRGNNIITTIVQHWDDDKTGLLHWCVPASVSLWECRGVCVSACLWMKHVCVYYDDG